MSEVMLRLLSLLGKRQHTPAVSSLIAAYTNAFSASSCLSSTSGTLPTAATVRGYAIRASSSQDATVHGDLHKMHPRRAAQTSARASDDYYEILGVARSASDQDIKKSFYKLAKQYHPDTNQGDEAAAKKFQEVQKAYETLRDPDKRRMYDQYGREGMDRMESEAGGGGFSGGFEGFQGVDPTEFFSRLHPDLRNFYHHFQQSMAVQVPVRLSFMEAVKGARKTLNMSGLGVGTPLEVEFPAGVMTGQQIQLPKQQRGQQQVNVVLLVEVEPHPTFQRDGDNIVVKHKMPLAQALLGGETRVDTIDGKHELKVPPLSQNGDMLVMRGKGTSLPGRPRRGDQIVVLQVDVPAKLSKRQQELLEEFQREEEQKSKSWW